MKRLARLLRAAADKLDPPDVQKALDAIYGNIERARIAMAHDQIYGAGGRTDPLGTRPAPAASAPPKYPAVIRRRKIKAVK
jgi:hypothetical protein